MILELCYPCVHKSQAAILQTQTHSTRTYEQGNRRRPPDRRLRLVPMVPPMPSKGEGHTARGRSGSRLVSATRPPPSTMVCRYATPAVLIVAALTQRAAALPQLATAAPAPLVGLGHMSRAFQLSCHSSGDAVSDLPVLSANLAFVQGVCCSQLDETCGLSQSLPTACGEPACARVVELVSEKCGPLLSAPDCFYCGGFKEALDVSVHACADVHAQRTTYTMADPTLRLSPIATPGRLTDGMGVPGHRAATGQERVTIRAPTGQRVAFQLETQWLGSGDVLYLYDGVDESKELAKLRGTVLPANPLFISSGEEMRVVLVTADIGEGVASSFSALFEFACDGDAGCGGRGKCTEGRCVCPAGYFGDSCEDDSCARTDCGAHGVCERGGTCRCLDGFGGGMCDQAADTCKFPVDVDCGANGSCVDGTCVCASGYSGDRCQHVDQCYGSSGSVQDLTSWISSGQEGSFDLCLEHDVDSTVDLSIDGPQDVTIRCNKASGELCRWPGRIHVGGMASVTISRLSFTGLVQAISGGCDTSSCSLNINSCGFNQNTAPSGGSGAAMRLDGGISARVMNCSFTDNHAGKDGGAMFWTPEVNSLEIDGCIFHGNAAGGFGDAVDVWGGWMAGCAPTSLKWTSTGYSNEAAMSELQPYSYTGCLAPASLASGMPPDGPKSHGGGGSASCFGVGCAPGPSGDTATCRNGMVRQSDGCHCC